MKHIYLFAVLFTLGCCNLCHAQPQEMAQNFNRTGFIQNIKSEDKTMIVNFVDKQANTIFHESIKLDATVYTTEKKLPLTIDSLSSSDEITIIGDKFSKYCVANQIIRQDKKVSPKREGRVDDVNGDVAIVDGIKVKLDAKTKIKGKKKSGFSGRTYESFKELIPGILAEVDGKLKSNNFILSNDFVVAPDNDDKYDQAALESDKENYNKFKAVWSDKTKRSQVFGTTVEGIGTVVNDAELQEYVNSVGLKLVPGYLKNRVNFMFIVVDNPDATANVRANGLAYVYTGLLKSLDNESQLAAVLGHEIAHVLYKHSADELSLNEKTDKAKANTGKTSKVASGLKGDIVKGLGNIKDDVGLNDKNLKIIDKADKLNQSETGKTLKTSFLDKRKSIYSVNQELQADRVGMALMVLAGYDPREAPIVWKNLIGRYEKDESEEKSAIVTTLEKEYNKDAKKTTAKTKDTKTAAPKKTDVVQAVTDDEADTSTADKVLSFFIKAKTEDNINKSYETSPDELKRFEEMNRLVSAVWDSPEIYKNAQNNNAKKYLIMKKRLKNISKGTGKK